MDLLKRLEAVWPNAERSWDLLYGWKMQLSRLEAQRLDSQSQSGKRPADEELYSSRSVPAPPGEENPRPGYVIPRSKGGPSTSSEAESISDPSHTLPYRNIVSQMGYGGTWGTHPTQDHFAFGMTHEAGPSIPLPIPLSFPPPSTHPHVTHGSQNGPWEGDSTEPTYYPRDVYEGSQATHDKGMLSQNYRVPDGLHSGNVPGHTYDGEGKHDQVGLFTQSYLVDDGRQVHFAYHRTA